MSHSAAELRSIMEAAWLYHLAPNGAQIETRFCLRGPGAKMSTFAEKFIRPAAFSVYLRGPLCLCGKDPSARRSTAKTLSN
jgi:hypothetical protein